ncbi:MAG: thiamine phosphate synthase [Bacteroidales bacterium]|nr:thiamine phosphate synthase [Bacteroidales bacterium]
MNRIIVITAQSFLKGEAAAIVALLEAKAFRVHIRKPQATTEEVRCLIQQIPEKYHVFLSLHDHFELASEFEGIGLHLNSRHSEAPSGFDQCISLSCHSSEELEKNKPYCYYLTLGPVFDETLPKEELIRLSYAAVIDGKVFAHGKITPETMQTVCRIGFGGACVSDYLWLPYQEDADCVTLVKRLNELQNITLKV